MPSPTGDGVMGTLCWGVHDDFLARLLRVGNGSEFRFRLCVDGMFRNWFDCVPGILSPRPD